MSKPSAAQQTSRATQSTRKGMLGLSALPDRSIPASEPGADGQQEVQLPLEGTPEAQAASDHSEGTQGVTQSSERLELAESQCPAGDGRPGTAGSSASGQEGTPEHEEAVLNLSLPGQQQPGSRVSPASPEEALSLGLQWLQSMYSGPADEAVGFPQVQDSLQDFKSLLSGLPLLTESSFSVQEGHGVRRVGCMNPYPACGLTTMLTSWCRVLTTRVYLLGVSHSPAGSAFLTCTWKLHLIEVLCPPEVAEGKD